MDYAEYALRKFSTAVGLAVIKRELKVVSTPFYISQLQTQIRTSVDNQDIGLEQISTTSNNFQEDIVQDNAATPVQFGPFQDIRLNTTTMDAYHENTPNVCGISHDPRSTQSQNSMSILEGYEKYGNIYFDNQECGQRPDYSQEFRNKDQSNTKVAQCLEHDHERTDGQEKDTDMDEGNVFTQTLDSIWFGQKYAKKQSQTSKSIENVKNHQQDETNSNVSGNISQTTLPTHNLPEKEILSSENTEIQNLHIHDIDTDIFSQNTQDLIHDNNLYEKSFITEVPFHGKNTEILPTSQTEDTTSKNTESQMEISQTIKKQNLENPDIQTESQNKNTQIEICIEMLSQDIISAPEVEDVTPLELDKDDSKGVPFKTMMELNKVKQILSQIEDINLSARSSNSDSGYTSGSQSSASQKFSNTAPLSDYNLNEAASTIVEHLAECCASTLHHSVTADMADTLGHLVDALHRQGTYPSFLQLLLQRVEQVLKETCGGSGGRMFNEKEESLHRLFLLTDSKEIMSFAIDKLLDSLDSFHGRFTKEPNSMYESNDVSDIENQGYTFHLLETLTLKYLSKKEREKDVEDQEELLEDLTPTPIDLPSSIADIWRQRWDPDFGTPAVRATRMPQRKVLSRCASVLNKFIVGCMDGYSLMSYAALECYNSLQNSSKAIKQTNKQ